jgi:hypothetical protein
MSLKDKETGLAQYRLIRPSRILVRPLVLHYRVSSHDCLVSTGNHYWITHGWAVAVCSTATYLLRYSFVTFDSALRRMFAVRLVRDCELTGDARPSCAESDGSPSVETRCSFPMQIRVDKALLPERNESNPRRASLSVRRVQGPSMLI